MSRLSQKNVYNVRYKGNANCELKEIQVQQRIGEKRKKKIKSKVIWSNGFEMHDYSN